jgi:hypothetical protein
MHRVRRPLARTIVRGVRRLAALVLGAALLACLLRGGGRYLFCPMVDAVVDETCCAPPHDTAATLRAPDCCQTRTIGVLPCAPWLAPAPHVAPAPVLASLPAVHEPPRGPLGAREPFGSEPTGPPPCPSQRSAWLMVFLI